MRHRHPPPSPPPLGGIVIDGSNVIAAARHRALARLDAALQWCRSWRADLPVQVFIDARTVAVCRDAQRRELEAWAESDHPAALRLCPAGIEADVELLQLARERTALVLSNDRFFDHDLLRRNVVTVQFTFAGGVLQPAVAATWFRSPGQAVRVSLEQLQAPG